MSSINIDFNQVDEHTKSKNGFDKMRFYPKKHGLNYIVATPEADKIMFDVSAKILGNDYRKGISLNTYDQFLGAINDTKIVHIKPGILYNESSIQRIDPCSNIDLSFDPKYLVDVLMLSRNQKGYNLTDHDKGITIHRSAKSRNDKGNFYSKRDEMLMAKNKDFIKQYPKAFTSFSDNTFRTEYQLQKHKDIKRLLNVTDLNLGALMLSDANPVHFLFNDLTKDLQTKIINSMTMIKNKKYEGKYLMSLTHKIAYIESRNRNLDAIMLEYEHILNAKDLSKYKREMKGLILDLELQDADKTTNQYDQMINEVNTKLLKAI